MEYRERVAMALRAVRDYLGMTQGELGEMAGVSGATISRYEAGAVDKPAAEQLVQIAHALGVPVALLVDPPTSADEVKEAFALHRAQQRAARGPA
jgi:transcriptional regulator with XRE-family HTH domain